MLKRILVIFSFLYFSTCFAQLPKLTENSVVSVITVGIADEVHSLYGHTALRIRDSGYNIDLVYNYGMFDFATENFVAKFAKGDLQYYAAAYPYSDFEYSYREDNRSIYEQVLNLSLFEKQKLYDKLNTSIYSQDRFYTYKFIDRNCTTKVIDIVNDVLENKPIAKRNNNTLTYREVLFPYAENHFYEQLGINLIFGKKTDNFASTLFLPLDLYENLKNTNYKSKPLVSTTNVIFEAKRDHTTSYLDSIYSLIAVLILILLLNNKTIHSILFSILGLIGTLFLFMSVYSFHKELYWNYNILLLNPTLLLLVFFTIQNNQKGIIKTCKICLLFLGIYTCYMINKIHFLQVLPIIITQCILLLRYLNNGKQIIVLDKTKQY